MSNLNYTEYWTEIKSIATELVSEAMSQSDNDREAAEELINDSLLHETVDGHQWVIYYAYNLDVIQHSDNEDYMVDNLGSEALEYSLKEGGLSGLHTAIAFWCMYADVQEYIDDAFSDYEDQQEAC